MAVTLVHQLLHLLIIVATLCETKKPTTLKHKETTSEITQFWVGVVCVIISSGVLLELLCYGEFAFCKFSVKFSQQC